MTDNDSLNHAAIDNLKQLFSDNLVPFVDTFITKTEQQLELLNTALVENDLPAAALIIHSIKGGSGSLGAQALHKLCQELELKARSGDESNDLNDWHNQLKTEFELYISAIRHYLS